MNAIKCLTCGTIIESSYCHEFVGCNCGPESSTWCAVDGGPAYSRRVCGTEARWLELAVKSEHPEPPAEHDVLRGVEIPEDV